MKMDANAESMAAQTRDAAQKDSGQFSAEQYSAEQYLPDRTEETQLAARACCPPEIRSERIAALQDAIAAGTYQVSAEQTAEAILRERQAAGKKSA